MKNLAFKRDAATFTFEEGKLTFAAPVEGHVLAAVFVGRGTFELDPPTGIEQRQISRFSGGPKLVDAFQRVVFFFTDDSLQQLQSQVQMRSDADAAEAGKAISGAEEKYQENYNDWPQNQTTGVPQMRNLAARMLSDLTDPDSRGFFLADFKGEHSGDLLFQISWNRPAILLLRPDLNSGDEVILLHINRGQYTEWWAGFHLADEYAKSAHPDHRTLVAHCRQQTISLDLANGNGVSATAEMEFEVNQGTPRLLPFNLQGVLRISDIVDGEGQKLAFIQEDRKLDSDPWLLLRQAGRQGTPYKIKISYEEDSTHDSRTIMQKGAGLFFVGARESWFPSFGAFDDRTNFMMNIHSPKKFALVATGELANKEKGKDSLDTQWKSDIPLGVVGFNYGDFVDKSESDRALTVTAYAGREVPDELKSFKNSLDLAQLAHRTQPSVARGGGDVANQMGIMTGGFNTASNAQYAAGVSLQALKFYEYCFGPLPFKHVSVTEQPIRGFGQSWPYLIFLPYDSLLDSATRNNLGLQDTAEAREFYN
ncbi:MAG TPA: hypothetical protein VFM21_07955, partial [Terriglobia bacterium]|nr:hypothetical protein [Terriglobia bacterium]